LQILFFFLLFLLEALMVGTLQNVLKMSSGSIRVEGASLQRSSSLP
jgi:hypothetical protein